MSLGTKCQNCGKGVMFGHNVSHSKRRTRKVFKPNLQYKRIEVNGVMKRLKLCANCIKLFKKRAKEAIKEEKPQVTAAPTVA